VRAAATELLGKTKDLRLPGRSEILPVLAPVFRKSGACGLSEVSMNTPYGLEIIDSCLNCKIRKQNAFCNMAGGLLKTFSGSSHPGTYPGSAVLFVEGQMPRGAFLLCSGRVKLSTTSRDGKVLILKIAEAGEMLGLSAVISGTAYEVTAETSVPCHVNFVERSALIDLIARNGELGLRAAEALSREFQSAYRDIHDLVLARSSAGKLARLLLSWTDGRVQAEREIRIRSSLTHEEMAQMIGASRETVTRLLSDLKKKEFIRLEGSTLVIRNKTALEALAV
jgi:CRP/FNR family transcriptional regulator